MTKTTPKITCRLATLKDMQILIDYRILLLKTVQKALPLENEKKLRIALKAYYVKAMKEKICFSYIAEHQKQAISLGTLVLWDKPGNFNTINGKSGYILNIYTLPEYRGLGKGFCILAYSSGGRGVFRHLLIFKLTGNEIVDFWSGIGSDDKSVQGILKYLTDNIGKRTYRRNADGTKEMGHYVLNGNRIYL